MEGAEFLAKHRRSGSVDWPSLMQPVTQNLRQPQPGTSTGQEAPPGLISGRARNIIVGTLTGALALALAYGIGWAEGAAKSAALEQQAKEQKVGLVKDTDHLRNRVGELEKQTQLLQARRSLHRSLMALELDNFGTAREHLAKAHELVSGQNPIPGSPLGDLEDDLVGVELGVTADPLPQRLELKRLADDFDKVLGP